MSKVQGKVEVCRRAARLRPLRVALVVMGQLYHTQDKTHSPPVVRISPSLAIWTAIVGLCCFGMNAVSLLEDQHKEYSLLFTLTKYSRLLTSSFYCIMTISRSRRLVHLMEHLETIDSHLVGVEDRRPRVLTESLVVINVVTYVFVNSFAVFMVIDIHSLLQFLEEIMLTSIIVVTTSFFRFAFILLAWDLQRALADARMPSHVVRGSRNLNLPRLQAMSLRVEEAKVTLLEYLGLPTGVLLLGNGVTMIVTFCLWIKSDGAFTIFCATINVYLAIGFIMICSSPHRLRAQVAVVERELLLQEGVDPATHHQVCITLATLARVSDMSVGGLFTLGTHNILQLAGFVTTYVVILLQLPSHVIRKDALWEQTTSFIATNYGTTDAFTNVLNTSFI